MKSGRIALAIGAACVMGGSSSLAQGVNEPPGPNISRQAEERGDIRRDAYGNIYEIRRDAYGYPIEVVPADPNYPRYYDNRGRLFAGGYLPPVYSDPRNIVRDWRRHRLQPPPTGHQWVQIGKRDYALVVPETGAIVRMVPRR